MNTKACVNCCNKKPVNDTTNRLVTEACGHVKCMDCLLSERAGCRACAKEQVQLELGDGLEPEIEGTGANDELQPESDDLDQNGHSLENKDSSEKKKPELSHIRKEKDAYVCVPCNKRFHARSQVAYHAYCNGQQKPYQCTQCSKGFATRTHFEYHMSVHRKERSYTCDLCAKSFIQLSKMKRHKLTHTKEKKYSCTQCNKGFNNLTSLRKHGLTHTNERPYPCDKCDRKFRDSSNFRRHYENHKKCGRSESGECGAGRRGELRAYQCPRCPHAFHSKKDMRRHAQVHTDSKPFRCKLCERRFRRKDNLERHIRNTHPLFEPASAVEYEPAANDLPTEEIDVPPIKQIPPSKVYETQEKTKLEILNPLPPLPEDVIRKHLFSDEKQDKPREVEENKQVYETQEKTKLEILNPLPPLPEDVIMKHLFSDNSKEETRVTELDKQVTQQTGKDETKGKLIDKSYILEANHARQSVIVGRKPSPVHEYVHKIRKANSMSSHKDGLPPIDEKKLFELENFNNLDLVSAPLPKNIEIYKNILYGKLDQEGAPSEEPRVPSPSPEKHWKRKMKLNIN